MKTTEQKLSGEGIQESGFKASFIYACIKWAIDSFKIAPFFIYIERNWNLVRNAPGVLILTALATWWATHHVMAKQIAATQNLRMIVKPEYEANLQESLRDPRAKYSLADMGKRAFDAGEYPYSVILFSNSFRVESDGEMQSINLPLYYAALWAQNPTAGRETFHQNLDLILQEIEKANSSPKTFGLYGYYRSPGNLEDLYKNLCKVEKRLPKEDLERKHLEELEDKILNFKERSK